MSHDPWTQKNIPIPQWWLPLLGAVYWPSPFYGVFFSNSSIPPGTGGVLPVCLICRFFTAANVLQRGKCSSNGKNAAQENHTSDGGWEACWLLEVPLHTNNSMSSMMSTLIIWVFFPPNCLKNAMVVEYGVWQFGFFSAKGHEWIWVPHCPHTLCRFTLSTFNEITIGSLLKPITLNTLQQCHTRTPRWCMYAIIYIYIHCILSVYIYIYIYIILHGPRATSSQIICRMNMQYSNCCQGISIISLHRCMNVACTCGNVWHYELNIGNIGQKL